MATTERIHPVDRHVGSRLRALRTAAKLSQGAIGEGLGLTFQQVQKYESGVNRISASKLFQLAHLLEIPIGAFFDGLEMPDFSPNDARPPVERAGSHPPQ